MFAICVQIIFEKTSSSLVGWTIYLTIRKMLTNPDPFFVVVYDVNHTIVLIDNLHVVHSKNYYCGSSSSHSQQDLSSQQILYKNSDNFLAHNFK